MLRCWKSVQQLREIGTRQQLEGRLIQKICNNARWSGDGERWKEKARVSEEEVKENGG